VRVTPSGAVLAAARVAIPILLVLTARLAALAGKVAVAVVAAG